MGREKEIVEKFFNETNIELLEQIKERKELVLSIRYEDKTAELKFYFRDRFIEIFISLDGEVLEPYCINKSTFEEMIKMFSVIEETAKFEIEVFPKWK